MSARRVLSAHSVHSVLSRLSVFPVLSVLSVFSALSVLSLLSAPSVLSAQSLPARLDARLDTRPFDRQFWGVALVDDHGKLLYGRNPRQLFIPASNTKIVVAAVASALLPPTWTVKTSLYPNGPVAGGVVQGDLVLYGRGDPTFGKRCFATDTLRAGACITDSFDPLRQLADRLRAAGIHEIRGDIVGDGSYFEPLTVNPNWETFDLNWWYAAPVTGLGFNDNSVDFDWGPGIAPGNPAVITMSPDVGDLVFENRTVTIPRGGPSDVGDRFFREPGTLHVWAEGTVALDQPTRTESFAMPDPNLYTARAFRQVLQTAGIAVTGTTRARGPWRSSPPGRSATGYSPSSTAARTGSPRCCSSNSAGSSAAAARGTRGWRSSGGF
jgi:serine-type D-Ala-D-Ala carboxypeptidase/endopeptidase (penicillin-binding protein 4)